MPAVLTHLARLVAVVALATSLAFAQGVGLSRGAVVLSGSDSNCSKPAVISFSRVRAATDEWQKIQSEGVRAGTARYKILMNKMMQRIRTAAAAAAGDAGVDLVVRDGDIADDKGLTVVDLSDEVIDSL